MGISEKHAKLARLSVSQGTCPFGLTAAETKEDESSARRLLYPSDPGRGHSQAGSLLPGGITRPELLYYNESLMYKQWEFSRPTRALIWERPLSQAGSPSRDTRIPANYRPLASYTGYTYPKGLGTN